MATDRCHDVERVSNAEINITSDELQPRYPKRYGGLLALSRLSTLFINGQSDVFNNVITSFSYKEYVAKKARSMEDGAVLKPKA